MIRRILQAGLLLAIQWQGTAFAYQEAPPPCAFEEHATLFLGALERFRAGHDEARPELFEAATHLAERCDRGDPLAIAAFYARLSDLERERGLRAEGEFDLLQARVSGASPNELPGLVDQLRAFAQSTAKLADVVPRAYALGLLARLEMRSLERGEDQGPGAIDRVVASAAASLELFGSTGHRTPTLEPLWVLGRAQLHQGDLALATETWEQLFLRAGPLGRDRWQERALLGLIGVARAEGSPFLAAEWLEELGSIRHPESCWSLARESAVQYLMDDEAERARDWLQRFPPSAEDSEIDPEEARFEWESLMAAAELRAGDPRPKAPDAPPLEAQGAHSKLLRAVIALEDDDPELALDLSQLVLLHGAESESLGHESLEAAEAHTVAGRALLALRRPVESIEHLESALALGLKRGSGRPAATRALEVANGSAVGEWLGFSAVEALGEAYVACGRPLEAAALFSAAHAPELSREACQREVLDLASKGTLGLVTWIAGADRSLAVHVAQDGSATPWSIPYGRRGIHRAVERLRDALVATRQGSTARSLERVSTPWQELSEELAEVLLPPSLVELLRPMNGTDSPGALALVPYGVFERVPFEVLLPKDPGGGTIAPLGCSAALNVITRLRGEPMGAASVPMGARAWTALGAPDTNEFDSLPGAARELRGIQDLVPGTKVLVGQEFTKGALEEALSGRMPLHIATHVTAAQGARGIAPMAFVTSNDELLSAAEVRALRPRLPLVILSACGSAEGVAVDGLSVRGMAQAMLMGGTQAAVVTLWPIGDESGRRASLRIHAALLDGAGPGEATRRARVLLWQLGEPPAEWAAYRALR